MFIYKFITYKFRYINLECQKRDQYKKFSMAPEKEDIVKN